jgi:hypothetical protein
LVNTDAARDCTQPRSQTRRDRKFDATRPAVRSTDNPVAMDGRLAGLSGNKEKGTLENFNAPFVH